MVAGHLRSDPPPWDGKLAFQSNLDFHYSESTPVGNPGLTFREIRLEILFKIIKNRLRPLLSKCRHEGALFHSRMTWNFEIFYSGAAIDSITPDKLNCS